MNTRGGGAKDARKGFRKTPVERLRQQRAASSPVAGTAGRIVAPSKQAVRSAVAAQTCPFCGAGPYRNVGIHTSKSHGVDKWELREMAGMTGNQPLCAPEVSAAYADASKRRDAIAVAREANKRGRRPQRWTSAGIEVLQANLREWEAKNPEQAAQAWRAAGTKGGKARAEKARTGT